MRYKTISIIFIAMIMFFSIIAGAVSVQKHQKTNIFTSNSNGNDAEIPTWYIGNKWVYDITISGGVENFLDLNNVNFNDLEFTLDAITDDYYEVSIDGTITGYATVNLETISFSGSITNTYINGDIYINKTTLTIEEIPNINVQGNIKPAIGNIPFDFDITGTNEHGICLLNFPFNVGEYWTVEESIMTLDYTGTITILGIPQTITNTFGVYVQAHDVACDEWSVVDTNAGVWEALRLNGDFGDSASHKAYFAPGAGSIVKVEADDVPIITYLGYGTYDIDVELVSTTFNAPSSPPETPSALSGPTNLVAGEEGTYTTITTDPDGDKIRYIIDMDDGSLSFSDMINSGEQVTITTSWTQKGTYDARVKARDKYSQESSWSEPITITITNEPPAKPSTPFGPENAAIKEDHTYTTSSTDPDNHRIRYQWSWGDGRSSQTELYNSGEIAQGIHRWTRKGDYEIKVKAIDEFGEESEWSDPFTVTMPRDRTRTNSILLNLLDSLFERYPFLELIFFKS
jgi:hypothetical protein